MFQVLTIFLFLIQVCTDSYGQTERNTIPLKNGILTPSESLLHHSLSHRLWQSSRYDGKYFIAVQLDNIADSRKKAMLAGHGVLLGQFLTGKTYLAIVTPGLDIHSPSRLGIKNLYVLPSELKLTASLRSDNGRMKSEKDLISVSCYPLDKNKIENSLKEAGAEIVDTKIKPAHTWFIRGNQAVLEKLARIPFVISISPLHLEDVPLNYNNHATFGVNSLSSGIGRNLTGKNLVLGIGDNADPSTHIDLAGKLIMRTDEPVADHGTHTSGTLIGGGILNPMYTGMAPRAHLVVNDFSNILVNSSTYISDFQMYLTSNSYYNGAAGCEGDGEYNALSNYLDSQTLYYPNLLHVFAAGNDGYITCSTYPASFATIKSGFQTAKNVLTVGSMNTFNYTIGPGSSRGPVADGRIKPEIVAGGVGISSTLPFNNYGVMTGTSMSCPTAAGILALITERYRQMNGGAFPDAALLKALVSNSADDLGNPGPDFTYGFGMINGRTTVEALEQNHYTKGTVANNGNQQIIIPSLPAGAYQLKIMLYWPDAPALPVASTALVNDLDLQVADPMGVAHLPLILDPSPAGINNNAVEGVDHSNNVEQVVVNNPPAGNYTVSVNGSSVPSGTQTFYLVYEIIQPSVTVEYPFGGETWLPNKTEDIRWSAYGGDPNGFTLEYSLDGGTSWNLISNTIPSSSRSYSWLTPNVVSSKALMRVTRNTTGYSDISDFPFIILDQPLLTVTNTCQGYARLNWNGISGAESYDIMQFSGDTMRVIGSTTDTSFLATPLNQNSSYWFSVRAVHGGIPGRRAVAKNIIPNSGACVDAVLNNDLLMEPVVAPVTGRHFTSSQPGNQQITVSVRNPGALATASPVSFSFQVNGGTPVTEISATPIPANSTTNYTFSVANSYDFSAAGPYDIKAWIHYAADTIPGNDTVLTRIRNLRNDPVVLAPSFTESFETALDKSYAQTTMGLDSLDRTDFSNSVPNGRLNTFFNSGFARTANRSILLDVTEQGTNAADSMTNTFNLSGYSALDQIWLDLYYKKQSVVPGLPGNQIWIRGNDQAAWIPVKSLADPLDLPGEYIKLNLDLTGILASAFPVQTISSSFQVRCGAEGKTPATSANPLALPGGGISFDDFIITRSQNDVGFRALIQPSLKNICSLGNAEKITILIRNYGTAPLVNIPVTYVINQDTVTEIVPLLAPKDSLLYTFIKTEDMSAYQAYHINAWVSNPSDNYRNNDSSRNYVIQTTPVINQFPYLEGFENNNGYWYSGGQNNSWQWGQPAKTIIHKAANGSKAWVTSLNGNYNDNEYSFLFSPCFDLTSMTKPVLSFSHIFQTEDNCNCDFHWVEYSLDDSVWTPLGNAVTGVNWYDDAMVNAWQKSSPLWHVSSFDIPVIAPKIRFRIAMYSDPGTNYEGVGIDDIHIFEKAPVFSDSLSTQLTQPVSGTDWIDFDQNGKRIFSIQPNGEDLGNTRVTLFRDTAAIRDTAGQYYGQRNWVIQTTNPVKRDVLVRYYFTDSEANKLIQAAGCASCLNIEDAYSVGVTQYHSPKLAEEDSSLRNNRSGNYVFHRPGLEVQVIPNDNGYYAETRVDGFSEFWMNGGGKNQDHPLAAWLKDFTALLQNSTGKLNWTSWQETGSLKYIIERSADSIDFRNIGETSAFPHLDSIQSYSFSDQSLLTGNNYYRLVLYFQNGDSLISPVQKIFYEGIPVSVEVYPNPTTGEITIKTPGTCRELQIFDVLGRKLMDRAGQGYIQQVSIAHFSRGVYFLKLFTDSGNKLIKLEKR
jgi:Subtilase family/Secretion system C-terminal sorting domain